MAATPDIALSKGLPANLDAERFVLGSILLDDTRFVESAGIIGPEAFSLESHRRIFAVMLRLQEHEKAIDRVTVAEELMRSGQLESVGGLSYLVSLDDGLPRIANLTAYIAIVREKYELRRLIFASQKVIDRCLTGEEDSSAITAEAQRTMQDIGRPVSESEPQSVGDFIEQTGLERMIENRGDGARTGFKRFDEMTGGLHPGELIILAARPSMGKTALALNICENLTVGHGAVAAVFSLEMNREQLVHRLICSQSRVDSAKWRAGYLNSDERRQIRMASNDLSRGHLFIDDKSDSDVWQIGAKCRRLKGEHGRLDLVVVDYLQLMTATGKFDNRNTEITTISRNLKLLAKELKAPALVLSQLSRAPETRAGDHRPQLSDLRDSGAIEQDADVVAFVYREEVYKPDREDLKGRAELILAKQRNGPIGRVNLFFLKHCTRFENPASEMDIRQGDLE